MTLCVCAAVPVHQIALKLLLDRVMDEDGCRGDSNGPFDEQTVKERRAELKRDKVGGADAGWCGGRREEGQARRPDYEWTPRLHPPAVITRGHARCAPRGRMAS